MEKLNTENKIIFDNNKSTSQIKRIKFFYFNSNWFLILSIIICISFIIGGFVEFTNEKISKYFTLFGSLYLLLYNTIKFLYKNLIYWNKKSLVIRINSYWDDRHISFNNIDSVKIDNNMLIIYQKDGLNYNFDLTDIDTNDRIKLIEIVNKYSC
ncbi:MAG: hypothetical protein QM539_10585 [Alphaproteobacteria bacterium]|nr:hypothetical protein [Alphaproteobacteria bacterium]